MKNKIYTNCFIVILLLFFSKCETKHSETISNDKTIQTLKCSIELINYYNNRQYFYERYSETHDFKAFIKSFDEFDDYIKKILKEPNFKQENLKKFDKQLYRLLNEYLNSAILLDDLDTSAYRNYIKHLGLNSSCFLTEETNNPQTINKTLYKLLLDMRLVLNFITERRYNYFCFHTPTFDASEVTIFAEELGIKNKAFAEGYIIWGVNLFKYITDIKVTSFLIDGVENNPKKIELKKLKEKIICLKLTPEKEGKYYIRGYLELKFPNKMVKQFSFKKSFIVKK